jgi:hypothetical protein
MLEHAGVVHREGPGTEGESRYRREHGLDLEVH